MVRWRYKKLCQQQQEQMAKLDVLIQKIDSLEYNKVVNKSAFKL